MRSQQSLTLVQGVLFFLSTVVCQAAFATNLTDQLIQRFQARISVLDREMATFRYEARPKAEMKTLADIESRTRGWAERFFDKAVVTGDIAGPGTYVAIDPFASRSFGGPDPQLYVFNLNKGIRTLSFEAGLKNDEKEIIKKIHNELQCKIKMGTEEKLISEHEMDFFSLRRSSTEACREAAISIAKALNIDAIIYNYSASNSLSGCRNRDIAINVVSTSSIDFGKTLSYSNQVQFEGTDEGQFIKKIYEESQDDFTLLMNSNDSYVIPTVLTNKAPAPEKEYNLWKRNKIFNCGPKWAPESKMSRFGLIFDSNMKSNFSDKEIRDSILTVKKALSAKGGEHFYFNLSSIVKIQKLIFKSSGLPQNEATFTQWQLVTKHAYEPEYQEKIKQLYHVRKTFQEFGNNTAEADKFLTRLSPEELKSPDLFLKMLANFGITGGYAVVAQNEMNMYRGGIILSSVDPKKSMAENIAISKKAYKAALNECLQIYSDPNLTFEEIQKTDCGIAPN